MWNISSTYQGFYSKFQRKISSQNKRKSRIKSKKLPPRRSTLGKISLRYEFIRREKIWRYKKTGLTDMADRGFSYKRKKYIDRLDSGNIWYWTTWMWDFTCPTFWKFEIFGQVGCRTCDTSLYKWLYRRL